MLGGMSKSSRPVPAKFSHLLGEIKARIQQAQNARVLSVNCELVRLYWDIGRMIDVRQQQERWGAAVIPKLARELHNELSEEKGFSERNLKYMIRFYREYADVPVVQQPAAQLSPQNSPTEVQTVAQVSGRKRRPLGPLPFSLFCSSSWGRFVRGPQFVVFLLHVV